MNECELYQELISRLVDGQLNKSEYAALREHMDNCSDCSAMYAVFASLSDIIGSEDEPLPEDLHENIMAGVIRHAMVQKNKRRLSKPMRNTLAAAACAALVLFAAKGLSPAQKAQDAVLTESQAAVMDAAVQNEAVEESLPAPAAVVEEAVPAASETPVPTATPVPTRDVYLDSGEDKEKTDTVKNNTNKSNNTSNKAGGTVYITAPPQEIVVSTPAPTPKATPKPTPKPTPVPTAEPTPAATAAPTATPVPTVAASQMPDPAPAALEAEAKSTASEPAATESAAAIQPSEAPKQSEIPAAAAVAETTGEPAEPSETPGRKFGLFAFFTSRSTPESEAVTAAEEPAAESAAIESPAVPSPIPAEKAEEEKEILIKLIQAETLTKLEDMVDGEEAELPEAEADKSYSFCLKEPDELTKDYKLSVYIYGEEVYYEQFFSEDESAVCLAKCSVEDFEKFLDSLSDEEKAPLLASPSPSPAAETLSPSPSAAPAQPSESPAASESPTETAE